MTPSMNRREMLAATGVGALMSGTNALAETTQRQSKKSKIRYCLNTSTIRESKLPLPKLIELTSKAGYDSIEPWVREIDAYVESGGSLKDIKKQLEDSNLKIESAIGFPKWGSNDDSERKEGIEEAKRGLDLVQQMGGNAVAAPPIGIHKQDYDTVPLDTLAERYHELLEMSQAMGGQTHLEIWGPSKNLSRLREAVYVATACNHPNATLLPDVYHMFRGGSSFEGLRMLNGKLIPLFHMNDYPSKPERTKMKDSDRVYPGDGVAPMKHIVSILHEIGFEGALSLELFNKTYWKQDPFEVAKTGLQKMKTAVES